MRLLVSKASNSEGNMALINTTAKYYTKKEAGRVAAELQAGELDGWTYVPANVKVGGVYVVRIFDEVGDYVGEWTNG